ncbi:exported protein of unknown function [Candidatus Methylomirabilis oxygeniifera]|uniref:Uncharacterized protein n=1 Tax=Methylomirabilis oxygeniifera TaxID=671143 RepID=D5MKC0_METO1|nr:exported protein of unknown function [Candidatus Methylomirabilis oxyfera]
MIFAKAGCPGGLFLSFSLRVAQGERGAKPVPLASASLRPTSGSSRLQLRRARSTPLPPLIRAALSHEISR